MARRRRRTTRRKNTTDEQPRRKHTCCHTYHSTNNKTSSLNIPTKEQIEADFLNLINIRFNSNGEFINKYVNLALITAINDCINE